MDNRIKVVANWKANEVNLPVWVKEFCKPDATQITQRVEVIISPPHTSITPENVQVLKSNSLSMGCQNISAYPLGAYTGEIPASMLANLGVKYTLLGHSERRKYCQESNQHVEAKLTQATNNSITAIICAQNIDEIPHNIRNFDPDKFLIMYEPFSAISTNGYYHPESSEKINETLNEWRKMLPTGTKFLYGGSVNKENIISFKELVDSQILSGFVIGHASLDSLEFKMILNTLCGLPN